MKKIQRQFFRMSGLNTLQGFSESPAVGSSGGLLSCWDESMFEVENHVINRKFIATFGKFRTSQFRCGFINVYGPSVEEEKACFFEELAGFICGQSIPLCVGGDFNVFTWCSNQDIPTFVRLDRFLVDVRFLEAFPETIQYLLPNAISDHNAIFLENGGVSWGKKPFRLFSYLMDEEGFQNLVGSAVQNCKRDRNTRFFHACASVRRRRNFLIVLNINGEVIQDPAIIKATVKDHFFGIYNSKSTLEVKDLKLNFSRISGEQSVFLEREFTEEEIWETLQSCDSNKAPEPDGLNMGFFKRFWSILKVSNIGGLDDFRPISLVGGLYKILSKCLSRRLRNCITGLISPTQFTFISGRQILDCSLIANEGVYFWRKKGLKGCVFKVDFRKAYDTVDWSILFTVMEKMGFSFKWRSWIRQCVTTTSISVLINGVPSQEFSMARGLRQGYSLSPMLFNLVGELLNLLLSKAVSEGLFSGLQFGRNETTFNLSHLQFADDLIIFCGASKNPILNVKRVLRVFELISGLQLNLKKSLPLGASRNSSSLWDPVVLQFNKKLAGWKSNTLSLAGRLVLIKSVLYSLPTYYLSLFKIPSSVNSKLNSIMSKFLWGGGTDKNKIHWVSWSNVCKSKEEGGLGVLNISNMNRALLGKWSWRFANERNVVWRRLICSKYNLDPYSLLFNSKLPAQSSCIWSSVDKWAMDCPLKVSFLRLFAISSNQSDASDALIWKGKGDGVYSVNSCVKICSSVVLQKLPVRTELAKRGVSDIYWSISFHGNAQNFLLAWEDLNFGSTIWNFIPVVVMWTVWKARNDIVFDRGKLDQTNLFFLARVRLASWFLAKFADSVISLDSLINDPCLGDSCFPPNKSIVSTIPWSLPPKGFVKLNVDATTSFDRKSSRIAGILRDEEGLLLGSFKTTSGPGPPILMELNSVKEGLNFFHSVRGRIKGRLIIESDCKMVVDWIKDGSCCPVVYASIVREVAVKLKEVEGVIRWVARTTNIEADGLAKYGIG
ncbi:uncharacterized protein LOC120123085 [Hibiscus syriacus]|uniref:uncharacterized protein LOC120123085 n=1 Tax=Hibiscus syriacus TaxID=106335 RepID=UPI0019222891|nr:uncharacterized protein LOC120123085 [Hibiscus syriacus]